jgi:hypothetical protein
MLDHTLEREILDALRDLRNPGGSGLEIRGVRVRANVARLASLTRSRPPETGFILNLSAAVLEAGPEAWKCLAPAFEGDRAARRRLRELTRPPLQVLRSQAARGRRLGSSLPDPRCDGTPQERAYLRQILAFFQATSGCPEAFPPELQLRISRRMTAKLGLFSHRGGGYRITLSQRLFQPGLEAILWDTVRHELAHLADHFTSPDGKTSHGPRWRGWALRLGARPEPRCSPAEALQIVRVNRSVRGRARAPLPSLTLPLIPPPGLPEWRASQGKEDAE